MKTDSKTEGADAIASSDLLEGLESEFKAFCESEWKIWRAVNPPPMPIWNPKQLYDDWPRRWMDFITPKSIAWWKAHGRRLVINHMGWFSEAL